MIKSYVKRSTLNGTVKDLMTPGLAAEFIQPWYTPLPTSPLTTGMPVGGISSAFTVTPAGTTPVLHALPGVQVRGTELAPLQLNNFFFRESILEKSSHLHIIDFGDFQRRCQFYPLINPEGEPLFAAALQDPKDTFHACTQALQNAIENPKLWASNQDRIQRWKLELSPATQAILDTGSTESSALNRAWIIDYFNGAVGEEIHAQGSLTADWEENSILGQPCYSSSSMHYQALYPVAETRFEGGQRAQIKRWQYSPVIPQNERLSSLPVNFTLFELSNPSSEPLEITLVQMQENLCGYQVLKERHGVQDAAFILVPAARGAQGKSFRHSLKNGQTVTGIEFSSSVQGDLNGTMAMAVTVPTGTQANITVKPQFYSQDQASVLEGALASGRVNQWMVRNVYSGRETMAGALCATVVLQPGETVELLFSQALDFSGIDLVKLSSQKKYTEFFPQAEGRAQAMLLEILDQETRIREDLSHSYNTLLADDTLSYLYPEGGPLAESFRTLALNTLAFLTEATVWDVEDRFWVRECADYPFFNSLDVYFYGSFGLLTFMPRLDGVVMRHFAQAVLANDSTVRRHHEYVNHPYADLPAAKLEGLRGIRGAVIHDLGSPFDAAPDAYDWHNVKEWKDLAPKFVLMVLRHYHITQDLSVVEDCKEAVYVCMKYLQSMIETGEVIPLTRGTDDTFDNLSSHGISIYCGSLWFAGLKAAAKIAEITHDKTQADEWNELAQAVQQRLHDVLWDEKEGYFHFYATPITSSDLIDHKISKLPSKLPGIILAGSDRLQIVQQLNDFIDTARVPESMANAWARQKINPSANQKTIRQAKKRVLLELAGDCLTPSFAEKVTLDSDDVFADSMLADTYLQLLGLGSLTDEKKSQRTLEKVFLCNFKTNSPNIGAANLVHLDGSPLDEFNFQAHDVWIGIQYSLMTAMTLHGMKEEARELGESMVRNLYTEARIPFAAPEGFNGSCRLHASDAAHKLNISHEQAQRLVEKLQSEGALLEDCRIAPKLTRDNGTFTKRYQELFRDLNIQSENVFFLLHTTALKYTAGRYFRPGMVWAIPMACKLSS